jgi:DNA-3-methyladenine glycosylase II
VTPGALDARALRADLRRLARDDAAVATALDRFGYPELRRRPAGFQTLLRAIVAQQISVSAAKSIWTRIETRIVPLDAATLRGLGDAEMRACGLSRQKMAYMRSLAHLVHDGEVRLDALEAMADEDGIAELVKIKGIGRWTAQIYLMFALGRRDVMPADDLGLMEGMKRLRGLRTRPDRRKLLRLTEAWRPYRSAGAHLLWHYFHRTQETQRGGLP